MCVSVHSAAVCVTEHRACVCAGHLSTLYMRERCAKQSLYATCTLISEPRWRCGCRGAAYTSMPLPATLCVCVCVCVCVRACVCARVCACVCGLRYPGDEIPVVKGSALCALNGTSPDIGKNAILKLMESVDAYIPVPQRSLDLPFQMCVEDTYSIAGRGTVVTGCIEKGTGLREHATHTHTHTHTWQRAWRLDMRREHMLSCVCVCLCVCVFVLQVSSSQARR